MTTLALQLKLRDEALQAQQSPDLRTRRKGYLRSVGTCFLADLLSGILSIINSKFA